MGGNTAFPTTSWTMVLEAAGPDTRRTALENLCAVYWPPVCAFIAAQTRDPELAKDLTQAFFARMLENHRLNSVRPDCGRFRSFLLTAVKHFVSNERERARALKRGGGREQFPLEFAAETVPAETATPERVYERRWALLMLDRALGRLRGEYAAAGQAAQFEALHVFLAGGASETRYADAGAGLGMSEAAVKMAVHRMRRRYGEALRAEIAQTVSDPNEVDAEIRYLLSAVAI